MKIAELRVRGYRSLRDVVWRPGDLNVLIGPNGGGKSNLLRVLQLLQAAADGGLSEWLDREGGLVPMMYDGSGNSIDIDVAIGPVEGSRGSAHGKLCYEWQLGPEARSGGHTIYGESLLDYEESGTRGTFFSRQGRDVQFLHREGRHRTVASSDIPPGEAAMSALGGMLDADPVIRETAKYIANWGVYPEFHTGRDSASRQSKPLRHETRVEWDGQNIMQVLHTLYENYPEFRGDVDGAMSVALSEEFQELLFPPVQDGRFQLRMKLRSLGRQLSAADLSDGTIRFLYLLAILANPEPPSLIAIDEPETGLHPVMQHIIAEFAAGAAGRTQVVLTTHSPEFLDCFGDTIPTTTVVEWQEGQGTTLRSLSGEALAEWVKRFSLGEILRTGEAAIMESEEEG